MTISLQAQIEEIQASIAGLEAQQELLGASVLAPALATLREKLAELEAHQEFDQISKPTEERRLITILFSDVVGSTALAEKLDPEEWRGIISRLHAEAGDIITKHQGQVIQYLGDGLLAIFGAEVVTENDPENAIHAALELQAQIPEVVRPLPENVREIQLRIGIHTGLVVLGDLGAESHQEFTATGDAMNLAARLQSAAPPGGILISQDSYRYVRGVFDLTPQPPLQVKGKRAPLSTYLVRRARPRPFRVVTRGIAGIETRTIGREQESEQIKKTYLEAFQKKKTVWVQLIGEPGIGKSRLIEDTREWLDLRPEQIWLLKARAYEGDRNQPFSLIRRLWFDRFQIAEDSPVKRAEARWVQAFQELIGLEAEEPAHVLGALVGLPFEDSPYLKGMRHDASQIKGRAFVISKELLSAMGRQNPVELLLEDLHNADLASWEYLREVFLAELQRYQGVFILGAARKEWQPPDWIDWLADQELDEGEISLAAEFERLPAVYDDPIAYPQLKNIIYQQLNLEPLNDFQTRDLAGELLSDAEGIPGTVMDMIVERAEGNPYYAEEMVNWFLDQGIIDRSVEPWHFREDRWREKPLPATLQHLVLTRISSLSEAERFCLQCAAIYGQNFWSGSIDSLGADATLLERLSELDFVEKQPESSFEGEKQWRFRQNMLREVVYESILKRERARLHRLAGEWLETQARQAGRLEEFSGLLGNHAEQAGELSAAADWYILAGERSQKQGASREAKSYFEQALKLLPPVEHQRGWQAMFGLTLILEILRDANEFQNAASKLLALAQEMQEDDRLAEAYYRMSRSNENYREALVMLEKSLDFARKGGNKPYEARALAEIAVLSNRLGDTQRAASAAKEALILSIKLDDKVTLATVLHQLSNYYAETGDIERSIQVLRQVYDIWLELGNLYGGSIELGNLGYTYIKLGQYKLADVTLNEALQINESVGARRDRAYNLHNLGLLYYRTGKLRRAREVLEESITEMEIVKDGFGLSGSLFYLGHVFEESGDVTRAKHYFNESKELARKQLGWSFPSAELARCALAEGALEEAGQQVEAVWNYLNESDTAIWEFPIRAYLTCADIFDALGETEKSHAAVKAGYNELMAQADKLSDPEWRRAYIENIREHRQIVDWWERLQD